MPPFRQRSVQILAHYKEVVHVSKVSMASLFPVWMARVHPKVAVLV